MKIIRITEIVLNIICVCSYSIGSVILNRVGLSYQPPMGMDLVTIYPLIDLPFMLLSFVLGVLSAIIGSIYPARKILQVNPIDALRST